MKYDAEWLAENACQSSGCLNYSESGYIYCQHCLRGRPIKLPTEAANAKLILDAQRSKQNEVKPKSR